VTAGSAGNALRPAHGLPAIWRTFKAGALAEATPKKIPDYFVEIVTMPSITQKRYQVPQPLSVGEETFARDCKVYGLDPEREVELIPGRHWRFDFYFREHNLAVEIEGATKYGKSRHSKGEGFEEDCRKYNAAAIAGIMLLRFSTAMVESGEAIDTVRELLTRQCGELIDGAASSL
jgi:hypothetical protein